MAGLVNLPAYPGPLYGTAAAVAGLLFRRQQARAVQVGAELVGMAMEMAEEVPVQQAEAVVVEDTIMEPPVTMAARAWS